MKMIHQFAACAIAAAVATPAAAQLRTFNLPAQAATTSIPEFARQAGIQILVSSEALRGVQTSAVVGQMRVNDALRRMLGGTNLRIVSNRAGAVVLRADATQATQAGATDPAGREGEDEAVTDVVVTAQRRAERQQRVPVTLTAFDARQARDYRLNQLQDVSRLTPGLLVSTFSLSSPIIAVRGATNTFNQIGVDKPVGIFIDDVYLARNSATTLELFGVNSIQVLKGPQGTLFGRNVTGGAIVIDTGRPELGQTRLTLRGTLGDYDTRDFDAIADLALGERAAIRVSGLIRQHDGWGRDRLTGQQLDDQDSTAIRTQLRIKPSGTTELLIAGDYSTDASGGRTLSSIQAGDDGDPRTAEAGVPQRYRRKQGGLSGRFFWETPIGELTSITAWRNSRSNDLYANVGANFSFLTGTQSQQTSDDRDDVKTFSQELRFASRAWDRGNFLLGAYFSNEDSARGLGTIAYNRTGAIVTNQFADQQASSRSVAVFADGTFNITPEISVSAGARYTWDRKRASLIRTNALAPATAFSGTGLEASWSQFTPRAVLKYQATRDLLFYASYARGYTAGGFNTEAATLAALQAAFAPETVENYEGGIKSEWFDRRLRLNLNAFHLNYDNKQELFFNNVTRVLNITNASKATISGFEAELAVRPVKWLGLTGTYGRLDTRYDQFVIPGGATLTGNRLGSSPRDKASATIDVSAPLRRGRAFGNVVYSYTADYFTGATNEVGLFIPGYSLVNVLVGYALPSENIEVQIFARNLLDQNYILIPSTQVVRAQYLGAPRVVGTSVILRF